jgi:hypothetical protein
MCKELGYTEHRHGYNKAMNAQRAPRPIFITTVDEADTIPYISPRHMGQFVVEAVYGYKPQAITDLKK